MLCCVRGYIVTEILEDVSAFICRAGQPDPEEGTTAL